MEQGSRFFIIVSVLILGIILQLFLGFADSRQTPARTAAAFSKAYFDLDPSMADYLCEEYTADEGFDPVANHLRQIADDARVSGFEFNYMRSRLFSLHTEILSENEDQATVHVTADRKRNINPIFTIVGNLFRIGETHKVDETLELVKEDGKWKVCGRAYDLSV